jgi:quercetin dioxygenase-like cupin family protein
MGDTLTVKMSCVFVGTQTHAPHTHNEDEAFYIIRGPVNFHINGEERILQTGDFVYTPSGSYHNIQRIGDSDTIKYLVIKRETTGNVDRPHPVSKPNYAYDDCTSYPASHAEWTRTDADARLTLLDRSFADGFNIVLERAISGRTVYPAAQPRRPGQVAFYVISGEATVTLDGQPAQITADNTFYCPAESTCTVQKTGSAPLLYLTVTTE